jgi:tetratricopeptide (TPR) repeat protein
MRWSKFAPLCGALLLVGVSCGCDKLKARNELNHGVAAYRNAQFQPAIEHFKKAVSYDPTLLNAKLYLATAYAQLYIPGGESPENLKLAQQAIDTFQDVLRMDPKNVSAIASIATIYYQQKKFEEAKKYQTHWLEIDPNNPVPYYWIGVLDWAICYPRQTLLRRDLSLNVSKDPKDPNKLPPLPEKARAELEKQNGPLVDEGLKMLQKAIDLKPNDFDTMAYLNLMYRQKADLEKDPDAREADIKQADEWVNKALALKKAAGQPTGGAGM